MQAGKQASTRILAVAAILAVGGHTCAQDAPAAPPTDPPGRVARISVIQGNVSLEPAGVDSFSQAELNYPLTAGDRVYADLPALAELESAGLAVRMSNGADVTLSSLTDQVAQFGLAQGSIRVVTRDMTALDGTPATIEIDTPNGSVLVQAAGDIRIDSYPQSDTTVVTVSTGQVEVTGPAIDQVLSQNQSLKLSGANPVAAQFVQMLPPDGLDQFDQNRESLYQGSVTAESQYVDPETIGAEDLDQYGDWAASADYGDVWYPRGVAVGWIPYYNGHWAWVAPWGWTWVEYEPWGFAPFHYGRWANIDGRWGWVPGPRPPVFGHPVHPMYSPALVAFVGGPNFSLSLGFGAGPGAGVAAWFPLGPREPYVPWYHASSLYVNRVNVTNLYSRNAAEVRAIYANRSAIAYGVDRAGTGFANRAAATTAIPQKDFAAGRSVPRATGVNLDANTRMQLNQAPILPHPMVTPAATIAAPQAPARAVPGNMARPMLTTRAEELPAQTPSPAQSPSPAGMRNANRPAMTQPLGVTPAPSYPATSYPNARPHQTLGAPAGEAPQPATAAPVRAPEEPRTLINQTRPQPVQPKFEQQQQEIERNDPGRPLGPVQVENLRQGRPAGASPQAEPIQHPAPPPPRPEPRPAPAPAGKPR